MAAAPRRSGESKARKSSRSVRVSGVSDANPFSFRNRSDPGVRRLLPCSSATHHDPCYSADRVYWFHSFMARCIDPSCKRCRREQMKLYLKGSRCFSPKCPIDREALPPGMHGTRRSKQSEYGIRLREKQRLKWFYGLLERQFRRYLGIAAGTTGNTGEAL